jgi:Mg-chelatase subunit ChlD
MVVCALVAPSPVAAAPGESTVPIDPIDNPDLTKACGLDVLMIIDSSGSIGDSGATDEVQDAFRAFVASLKNTGSRMSVVQFSTVATLPSIGGAAAGTYVTIDNTTEGDFEDYIDGYDPDGWTNWEDALRVGRYFAPRPSAVIPHLVVFLTDGDPTASIRIDRVTQQEYETKVPLNSSSGSAGEVWTNQNSGVAVTPAIPNANALKAEGSHMLALGVGAALQNQASVDRLILVGT